MNEVWVFTGARNASLPAGVFSSRENAEAWITKQSLSGLLTLYRVDVGAYEWAIEHGYFKPSKPHHFTSEFIGQFSGGDVHFHYESGKRIH